MARTQTGISSHFLHWFLSSGQRAFAYVQHLDDSKPAETRIQSFVKKEIDKFFSSKLVRQKEKQFNFKNLKAAPQLKNQSCVLRLIGKNHPRRSIIPI